MTCKYFRASSDKNPVSGIQNPDSRIAQRYHNFTLLSAIVAYSTDLSIVALAKMEAAAKAGLTKADYTWNFLTPSFCGQY
jgi:hypothetical protein